MIRNGVHIEDTFAEAFGMRATRLIVTADSAKWAETAAASLTGFATSVIGCGVEAGIERRLGADETPDGRPGVAILLFAVSSAELGKQVVVRVGQSVLTSPGSACFSGLDAEETVPLGKALRYFGDGDQIAKSIVGRRYWRVPVMDGEFVVEDVAGMVRAVGGGNFLVLGRSKAGCLAATERAIAAMRALPNVIMPFPGGIVRSGSKVGSKYPKLIASTNSAYCPTLRGLPASKLAIEVEAVLEVVIDGIGEADVREAMRIGMLAVCAEAERDAIVAITAGNYGGKLGKFHFPLREILA